MNAARQFLGILRVNLGGVTQRLGSALTIVIGVTCACFMRGLHELIASNPCARQFTGFEIGDRRSIRGSDWSIVGHFDQGYAQQCVVYADADILMAAFNRNTYTAVLVMLQSLGDYDAFHAGVEANPTLHLEARHEREALEEQFKPFNALLNFVSYFVGTIMAIAATLGAVNSLYAIVDSRSREIATLRAIGFRSGPIVAAVLCEAILLAVPGAVLGAALAWIFFNDMSASPFGFSFQLSVTWSLAWLGTVWALAMGLAGGLLPALRACRLRRHSAPLDAHARAMMLTQEQYCALE